MACSGSDGKTVFRYDEPDVDVGKGWRRSFESSALFFGVLRRRIRLGIAALEKRSAPLALAVFARLFAAG